MIEKSAILCIILLVTFLRAVIKRFRGDFDTSYLFVSAFVIAAPFNFEWPITLLIEKTIIAGKKVIPSLGTYNSTVSVNAAAVIALILIVSGCYKLSKESFSLKNNTWLLVFLGLCLVTFINPYNLFPTAVFSVLVYFLQLNLLFKLFESNFSKATILRGTFDGLAMLTLLITFLAICYPILNERWAATIINGKEALDNSFRRAGFPAAIGMFVHPNSLGFYTIFPIAFYTSCLLNGYSKKNIAALLLVANIFICFLTFSRASYLAIGAAMIVLLLAFALIGKVKIKTKSIYLFAGVASVILLLYGYLVAYQNLQLFSNLDAMLTARENHWELGYEIWKMSPFLGVGINSHVYFMSHSNINYNALSSTFLVNVPIHNIHIIVLAETGLIGIAAWLYFIFLKLKTSLEMFQHKGELASDIFKMTFFFILVSAVINGIFDIGTLLPHLSSLILFFGYFASIHFDKPKLKSHNI